MRAASHFQSVGKFLYTQNPFYLISCGLILYGIQLAAPENMSLESRCWMLAGAMAGYTLLMAVTAIGVIRIGKVWQDARSILLVVIIGLIGLSVSFDQLCISNWRLAAILMSLCGLFAVAISELIFFSCSIKFGVLYRLPYYAILIAFFSIPVVAGYAVEHELAAVKNWMSLIFSTVVASGLILLAPAVKRRGTYLADNGTPWQWPLFPLSAFIVLVVLAVIRAHAIWMSFSTLSGPIAFEPFLLMPFLFAVAWLLIEYDSQSEDRSLTYTVMTLLPLTLVTGLTNVGLTRLPIESELDYLFGSTFGLIGAGICLFYFSFWLRGQTVAGYFLVTAIMCGAVVLPVPDFLVESGIESWMIATISTALLLGICIVKRKSDWSWLAFSIFLSSTLLVASQARGMVSTFVPTAYAVLIVSALIIGATFKTKLAKVLRVFAAISFAMLSFGLAAYQVVNANIYSSLAVIGIAVVPLCYLMVVKRRGWIWVVANNFAWSCLSFVLVSRELWAAVIEQRSQFALPVGVICFVVAVTITSAKTGVLDRSQERFRNLFRLQSFQVGL